MYCQETDVAHPPPEVCLQTPVAFLEYTLHRVNYAHE